MVLTVQQVGIAALLAALFWLLNGRPWMWDGKRWSETLDTIWGFNIPKHAEKQRRSEEGLPGGFMKASKDGMQAEPRTLDEWRWILVLDRFAVPQANEIERAECAVLPYRFELWLRYQIQVKGGSLRDLADERRIPLPVLSYYAWRFGVPGDLTRDWSLSDLWRVPEFVGATLMRGMRQVVHRG